MSKDNVVALENPSVKTNDPLTAVLRRGASKLLAQAIEAEVETLLALYTDRYDAHDRQVVVRKGYLPEREGQTGIGSVPVKVPRGAIAATIRKQDRTLGKSRVGWLLRPRPTRQLTSLSRRRL
jgi:hypothetical protein